MDKILGYAQPNMKDLKANEQFFDEYLEALSLKKMCGLLFRPINSNRPWSILKGSLLAAWGKFEFKARR